MSPVTVREGNGAPARAGFPHPGDASAAYRRDVRTRHPDPASAARPNVAQWLWYAYGGRLPRRLSPWVLADLTRRTWILRHLARGDAALPERAQQKPEVHGVAGDAAPQPRFGSPGGEDANAARQLPEADRLEQSRARGEPADPYHAGDRLGPGQRGQAEPGRPATAPGASTTSRNSTMP